MTDFKRDEIKALPWNVGRTVFDCTYCPWRSDLAGN
jgi:hypothetical protein